jgi:DivIVA domain-containing protein
MTEHAQKDQQQKPAPASSAYSARVPAEIRNASFPVGMRGYERTAVDAYVKRVNRVIAELEVTRSPQAAVRHAVERVEEQTKSVLEEARASAEKIVETAQSEADEIVAQSKAKAADLVVAADSEAERIKTESDQLVADSKAQAEKIVAQAKAEAEQLKQKSDRELAELQATAEARMRELEADTASVWDRRHELLDDIDRMANRLHEAAVEAAGRFTEQQEADAEPEEAAQTAVLPKPAG